MSEELFEAVLSAWQAIAVESDYHQLIQNVTRICISLSGATHGSLAIAEGRKLRYVFSTLLSPEGIAQIRVKFGEGIPGQVALTQDAMRVRLKDDSQSGESPAGTKISSILCVPMIIQQQTFGVVQVFNKADGSEFTPIDESRLQLFGNQAALALEHFLLQDRIMQESRRVQSIFEALTDGIMVVDPQGNPVLYNKAVETLFFPGGHQNYALTTYLSNLLKGRSETGSAEVFLLKPHGAILSNRYVFIKDKAGVPQEIIVSIRNITDQSGIDRRFSQFYAIMLRFSRKIIRKTLQVKQVKKRKKLLAKQRTILKNLVFLTDLKSGPLRIEKENEDMIELYREVREKMAPRLAKRGLVLADETVLSLGERVLRIEPGRFRHVFQILFRKALSCLPAKAGEMRLRSWVESNRIHFEIIFLGKNVHEKINPLELEWNKKVDQVIAGETKNLNLDLAFLRHLVRAHKGNVTISCDEQHRAMICFDVLMD